MAGRLAIDFGTSNTLLALWDGDAEDGVPVHVPEYGRPFRYRQGDRAEQISVIPSIIHYASDGRRWLGQQVIDRGLYDSPQTFRWMKRYISQRNPGKVRIGSREVSHFDAGRAFLAAVLRFAVAETQLREDEEVALTVPVESFEHYEDWLGSVALDAGMPRFRLIDEPSAAALGYGLRLRAGQVFLVFDFGGGTLDVAMLLIDEDEHGKRCRVLGKAGADLGGATIDSLLFQEVLRQAGRSDAEEAIQAQSRSLLVACERAKELLSFQESAAIRLDDPSLGQPLHATLTQRHLEELLDEHDTFARIDQTIRRALQVGRERGYDDEHITAVLLVGGSCLIPSVQKAVQRIFGRERVKLRRPLDAVVRGAAAFVAGFSLEDHIQHDYAVRYVDPALADYSYRPIVPRGTVYPTEGSVARLTVKASYDGQAELGLAIFELGDRAAQSTAAPVELVFDASGAARVSHVDPEAADRRYYFWVNEQSPTFLQADPPAMKGQPRFEVEFSIDGNKRLLLTARDLLTKRITLQNHPVVKLT